MSEIKILTGSREFWPDQEDVDNDYICVVEVQTDVFRYAKVGTDCHFNYRPVTKDEYLDWHKNSNNWSLNVAALTCKEWLEYLKIDIWGDDKEVVHNIHEKLFSWVYRYRDYKFWQKYAYRLFIYVCWMKNGSYILTPSQLNDAFAFKKREGRSRAAVQVIYDFFGAEMTF